MWTGTPGRGFDAESESELVQVNRKCISNQLPRGVDWACHAVRPRGSNFLDSTHLLARGLDFVFRAGLQLGGTYHGI